jgi:hypothetical protein
MNPATLIAGTAPQTDANVPQGHMSLHSALYGEGGAEAHDAADKPAFIVRKVLIMSWQHFYPCIQDGPSCKTCYW